MVDFNTVVYSGRDTKVMKKSGGARSKMSQVEKTMNMCIQIIFLAQFVLCTVTVIAWVVWTRIFSGDYPYLYSGNVEVGWAILYPAQHMRTHNHRSFSPTVSQLWIPDWLGNWFTFLLLFNNFIPISLYVTVEMVNYAQVGSLPLSLSCL
jgi:phospholipid-transporting ATPase